MNLFFRDTVLIHGVVFNSKRRRTAVLFQLEYNSCNFKMIHSRCVIKPVYVIQYKVINSLTFQIFRRLVSALYEPASCPSF